MTRPLYLILCVLGTVLPYTQFVPFLNAHGLDVPLFVEHLFANRIAAFFGLDVIVSALVVGVLVFTEGPRHRMRHLWIYLLATLAVGVSLALPLFLYVREGTLRSRDESKDNDRTKPPRTHP